jgi:hypothetical protein
VAAALRPRQIAVELSGRVFSVVPIGNLLGQRPLPGGEEAYHLKHQKGSGIRGSEPMPKTGSKSTENYLRSRPAAVLTRTGMPGYRTVDLLHLSDGIGPTKMVEPVGA